MSQSCPNYRKGYKMRYRIFTNFIFTAHGFSILPEINIINIFAAREFHRTKTGDI